MMFHENKELLISVDSSDLSTGNNYSTECIAFVLVRIPFSNQLVCMKLAKEELTRGTNNYSIFPHIDWRVWYQQNFQS